MQKFKARWRKGPTGYSYILMCPVCETIEAYGLTEPWQVDRTARVHAYWFHRGPGPFMFRWRDGS